MYRILLIVHCCLLAVVPAVSAQENDAAARLNALFAEEWESRLAADPIGATFLGVDRFNDRLPAVSPADQQARLDRDRHYLARLHEIDSDSLGPADRLNHDLFAYELEERIARAAYRPWRMPFVSDSGFHTELARMVSVMPFRNQMDYENYLARLAAIPGYIDSQIANMRIGLADGFTQPRAILAKVAPTFAALAADETDTSVFFEPFARMPETIPSAQRERLVAAGRMQVADAVLPAFRRLLAFFEDEYMPGARTSLGADGLPGGLEYYDFLVRRYTTLDLTAAEVHAIGREEVARIRGEMDAVIRDAGFAGTFAEFLDFLRSDQRFYASSPDELLRRAAWIAKTIDARMPAFFGTLPRMPYGVAPVPADIAPNYTTGRYWDSVPGIRGGLYMVNTYALDKRPLYVLPALTLHEAVPGHHHQISLAGEIDDAPEFRRRLYIGAFGEGWGLYAEKLGKEMGIYDGPYEAFGRLSYEMWRAGRLVVDTGIHAMGWSREQAVALFVENSALSLHNINTEVDRYISWPGQALGYKMGELKILELRTRAEAALGEAFDLRSFHDAVLTGGAMPLVILEERIDGWIAAQSGDR